MGFHIRTLPSSEQLATRVPPHTYAAPVTAPMWPSRVISGRLCSLGALPAPATTMSELAVGTSQMVRVVSFEPDNTKPPAGAKSRQRTTSACASISSNLSRRVTSQSTTEPSELPVARHWPSRDHASERTWWAWPSSRKSSLPLCASQRRTDLSAPHDASVRPSRLKAHARTRSVCPRMS